MNDLGRTHPEPEVAAAAPEAPGNSRVSYPGISLEGDQLKAAGLQGCHFGDEYEMRIKLRVTQVGESYMSNGNDEKPPRVSFDIIATDPAEEVEPEEEDEAADESREVERPKPTVKKPTDFAGTAEESDDEEEA